MLSSDLVHVHGRLIFLSVLAVFAASEVLAHRLGTRSTTETLGPSIDQYLDPVFLGKDLRTTGA